MIRSRFTRTLQAPLVTGWLALLCGIAAIAVPTAVRAAVSGVVTGCEFTPYLPFVLLSAVALGWWQAGVISLASVAILGGLFAQPESRLFDLPCFISGAAIFLGSSALIIATVVVARRILADRDRRGVDDTSGGVVFSLDQGEVWASWYGHGRPVRLGSQRKVSEMMEDFLAQGEVAKRLAKRSD